MFKKVELSVSNESESYVLTHLLLHPENEIEDIMIWLSLLRTELSNQTRFDYYFLRQLERQPFSYFNFLWIIKQDVRESNQPITHFSLTYKNQQFTILLSDFDKTSCFHFITKLSNEQ